MCAKIEGLEDGGVGGGGLVVVKYSGIVQTHPDHHSKENCYPFLRKYSAGRLDFLEPLPQVKVRFTRPGRFSLEYRK